MLHRTACRIGNGCSGDCSLGGVAGAGAVVWAFGAVSSGAFWSAGLDGVCCVFVVVEAGGADAGFLPVVFRGVLVHWLGCGGRRRCTEGGARTPRWCRSLGGECIAEAFCAVVCAGAASWGVVNCWLTGRSVKFCLTVHKRASSGQ